MTFNSFSFRLLLWYSIVMFIALLTFGILVYWGISNEIYNDQEALLAEKAERLNEHMRIDDKKLDKDYIKDHSSSFQFEENGIFYQIYNTKKRLMKSKNSPPLFHIDTPKEITITSQIIETKDGYSYHILITPTTIYDKRNKSYTFHIITGRSTIYANNILERIRLYGMLLIPLLLIIAGLGGWFLAKRALVPITNLTTAARSITLKNINKELPAPPNPKDELGQLTLTFNEMIKRIRMGIESIQRFTGDASHELRTPLTIMRGEIEVALRKPRDTHEYQNTLYSSLQEIGFMEKIINDLLTLARIDAEKTYLQLRQTDINSLLSQVIQFHKNVASLKEITLHYYPSHKIIKQLLDPEKIRQVLSNIIDNAIKYTPSNGEIKISTQIIDQKIIISVSDNGIGIPKDELSHIFDRFYRVDKARSREMHSSGLGLSICKRIMEAHQGEIHVESKLNKGTRVEIILPATKPEKTAF